MEDGAFSPLWERARRGEPDAVAELLRRYEAEVRLMVRARLPRALRGQFDSLDFVQSVWASLFAGGSCDEAFEDADRFRRFVAGVARNKVYETYRRRTTRKYDIAREETLYVRRRGGEQARDVAAPDPTPSQVVQADDRLEQLTAGCDATEVTIVELRREGLTFDEIARRVGVSDRTARRVIDDARRRLEGSRWS